MKTGEILVEVLRGGRTESVHAGHAVVVEAGGGIVAAWGDPGTVMYPRSSCKMIQALPLVESGAADAFGASRAELALACASHRGAPVHTRSVADWLARIERTEHDLCCGPELPRDESTQHETIRTDAPVSRIHNNCSGKHTGYLTLARHLGAGPDYADPDHPVQRAVRAAVEETTGAESPGFAIDGCSAPNFATTVEGLARAMADFASAGDDTVRGRAQRRLFAAMVAHPELVAGEGAACTELMRALGGSAAVKTGAEGVYVAILPDKRLGVALKISDGATRASECAITAILVKLGLLEASHPIAARLMTPGILNRRDTLVGEIRPADALARA